ncbi:MAG: sugar ABC transporter permease [Paenibacillaceae bacterium]|nr:sugar ABC transporter permease [Paenibacillaceae bacterium]
MQGKSVRLIRGLRRDKYLLLMMAPGLLYFVLFRYVPMGGLLIAFQDYDIFRGFWNSKWVGFAHFRAIFALSDFWHVVRNTLLISLYKLLFGFPVPIVLAILLNELKLALFKRVTQTLLYLPHFISWVVLGGIMLNLLSPNYGIVNDIIVFFGGEKINLLASTTYFRSILVASDIWKNAGWGTILYLAALTQVDPTLYEAAVVDGAGKWRQMWHITLPAIASVVILLLILDIGRLLNAGFEQILVLQNPIVRDISDVFETYVYRVGLGKGDYSVSSAVDLFKSVVALFLIVSAHKASKRFGQEGIT